MTRSQAAGLGPRAALTLSDTAGHRAGEDRFRLLEAIARTGSIAAAAKDVGLSYKAAWDAVNALNNLFARPLVAPRPGGVHGGGTEITAAGLNALRAHRQLTEGLERLLADLDASLASDTSSFPSSIWSFLMRTSVRNCFHGTVAAITHGAVNTEVRLQISWFTTLVVILTRQSVDELDLREGRAAFALIKASVPILVPGETPLKTSARNQIPGTVLSVEPGAINAEVVIDIGSGKTLAAIVTSESARALKLEPGDPCLALIKASQIILGVE